MIRAFSLLTRSTLNPHPYHPLLHVSMSGIKLKNHKKPTSSVLAALSNSYLLKQKPQQFSKEKSQKSQKSATSKPNPQQQRQPQDLKDSWLGSALEDDLFAQINDWQGDSEQQPGTCTPKAANPKKAVPKQGSQSSKAHSSTQTHTSPQLQDNLKIRSFKRQLSKTEHINNTRKFLDIICNIFPRHQVERILAQIKQFCSKRDLNMPSIVSFNMQNQKTSNSKSHQKKLEKEIRLVEKITKDRERKVFVGVRKIFDETLTDLELIDSLLGLLAQSDPYLMNSPDIHKLIYNHDEGMFEDDSQTHKSGVNLVLDKKHPQQGEKDGRVIEEQRGGRRELLKNSEAAMGRGSGNRVNTDGEKNEEYDAFDEFNVGEIEKDGQIKLQHNHSNKEPSLTNKQQQKHEKKRERSMKLIVKKNLHLQQKPAIPESFQINQQSLHQIERILFKNKKVVQDNVVFKKVKPKHPNSKVEKERQDFGNNWVYAYEMPYALEHQASQQFVDYISKSYGDVLEYFIFPYKHMLEKRESIMIHVDAIKKAKLDEHAELARNNGLPDPKTKKPQNSDKLLQKIEKQKNLKLNKSSMVFKFAHFESKKAFMLPEMRLYGINLKNFRNIRFEEAQSKKIIAISMIPWGCSSNDLLRVINKALRPIDIEVSYQSCILAKGFIFIELDNFYECLHACQLLNNLQFQGHSLKVQINYGSSKIYGEKYKNALEFDHYELLVKKLKDIKCFYNEIYQD